MYGSTGSTTFDHHSTGRDDKFYSFVAVVMRLLFFAIFQKRYFAFREHGTLQTCYRLWLTVKFSVL